MQQGGSHTYLVALSTFTARLRGQEPSLAQADRMGLPDLIENARVSQNFQGLNSSSNCVQLHLCMSLTCGSRTTEGVFGASASAVVPSPVQTQTALEVYSWLGQRHRPCKGEGSTQGCGSNWVCLCLGTAVQGDAGGPVGARERARLAAGAHLPEGTAPVALASRDQHTLAAGEPCCQLALTGSLCHWVRGRLCRNPFHACVPGLQACALTQGLCAGRRAQNNFELRALRCRPRLMHSLYSALSEAAPSCGQSEQNKWRPILVRTSNPSVRGCGLPAESSRPLHVPGVRSEHAGRQARLLEGTPVDCWAIALT